MSNGSASGSEIVAGALQDHGAAVILGTRTFGKASVQTLYPLRDGSGLRLTTGRYFTPNGRDIQAEGIEPDVFLPPFSIEEESEEEEREFQHFLEKDLEGHLEPTEGEGADSEERIENPELERFIETLKTKVKDGEVDGQKLIALEVLKDWHTFKTLLNRGREAS